MSANTAADAGGGAFLTEVEQSGVEKLSGVLSAKALDQKVRAVSELGLETYTLAESRFYLETAIADGGTDTGDVFAQLTYGKQDGEGGIWQKCVTVDARTGELESLWSGGPWNETLPRTVDRTAAREKAEAFLTRYWGEDFAGAPITITAPSMAGMSRRRTSLPRSGISSMPARRTATFSRTISSACPSVRWMAP